MVLGVFAAGCSAGSEGDPGAAEAEQNAAPAQGEQREHSVESNLPYQASAELAMALDGEGKTADVPHDVSVPGVLEIQHQYSLAALGLLVPSWALSTDDKGAATLFFPGVAGLGEPSAATREGELAAEKLYQAMVGVPELPATEPGQTTTTRTSVRGTFSCSRTAGKHRCSIRGLSNIASSGAFWR